MNKIILLNAIVGSQAYGTNTPDSDIDTKGVYLQDPMEVLGMEYKEQINLDKDACLYEVRRFLQLLCSGNPTMLELLYIPEDCILEKHPLWDIISKHRSAFLTKQCYFSFAGWGEHCKDYNSYQTWLKERNTQRYVDIQNHGQKIDGKNMLHCIRLLQCANDILDLKTINVRVKNPEYLLSIRHGKVSLEELLESARNQIKGLKQKFEDSDLPHSVDPDLVKSILNEIRKESLNLF